MSKQIDFLKRCIALNLQSGGLLDLLDRIEELERKVASRDAEVAELKQNIEEECAIREKLAYLLAETAISLKGEEAALTRHSWHDLAQCANDVVKERYQLSEQVTLLRDALTESRRELDSCQKVIWLASDYGFDPAYVKGAQESIRKTDEALAATADLDCLILCHAEPVAYLDANYGFMRCGNVADSLSIGTQLYAPKMEPKNSSV